MKIYDYKGFPNPTRVRIALAEKNALQAVEFIHVDVLAGEHREPAFVAKNPSAAVPVLELPDGTYISESSAITEFIDQHFDGISLLGNSAQERAAIHMLQRQAESGVLDAIGAYFHHATEGLMESYQNNDWGLKQKQNAIDKMHYFNELLSTRKYLAGSTYSVADITLFAGLAFADFVKIDIPPACQHLLNWRATIASRPAVASI